MGRLSIPLVLLCLASFIYSVESIACREMTNCESCLEHSHIFNSCYWKDKTGTCMTSTEVWWAKRWWGESYGNGVWKDYGQCNPVTKSKPYNHTLATELAAWSSLAYINPVNVSEENLEHLVEKNTNGQYKVLTFMQRDCSWSDLFSYSACSLLVALSKSESRIIISFEGTQNTPQLIDQLIAASFNGLNKTLFGGKVLHYNMFLHDKLYPCLKDYLRDMMENHTNDYSDYEVVVTGHSLGGTQAQLAAAYLVHDGVISEEKLSVYSFGAPRFADHQFSKLFGGLVPTNWRITQAHDPVPLVPDDSQFYHTHGEVWFEDSGIDLNSPFIICRFNEDEKCSRSQASALFLALQFGFDHHTSYIIDNIGRAFNYTKMESRGSSSLNQSLLVSETGNCVTFTGHS